MPFALHRSGVTTLQGEVCLKITVLLVEDSKFQKLVNERMLQKAGYTVLTASDGEEALRLARAKTPDIILLDMLLPKLGGREVMQALRADAPTRGFQFSSSAAFPKPMNRNQKKKVLRVTSRSRGWRRPTGGKRVNPVNREPGQNIAKQKRRARGEHSRAKSGSGSSVTEFKSIPHCGGCLGDRLNTRNFSPAV